MCELEYDCGRKEAQPSVYCKPASRSDVLKNKSLKQFTCITSSEVGSKTASSGESWKVPGK